MVNHNDRPPVELLYDREKSPENSNISRDVVVPLGKIIARSDMSHAIGRRLYEQINERNPKDPRLLKLRLESPTDPSGGGFNHCDRFVNNVLRLTRGVQALGSTQATEALAARFNGQGVTGDSVGPALIGNPHATTGPPPTQVQIAVMAGKEITRDNKGPIRRFVGLNGK